ncbi:MAG: PorT family protein [Bacteroidales bacterium]|nr:PorT family protein [Bacteroidales bacterium]
MRLFKVFLIAIATLVILFPSDVSAQRRKVENMPIYDYSKYHFGFILAVNQMHFAIKPIEGLQYTMFDSIQAGEISADSAMLYSIEHDPTIGFTVGIVGDLRLGNYFNLRFIPSLSFGQRYLDYNILKYRGDSTMFVSIRKDMPSTFVEFPLHIKYKSKRLNNFRAYVLGGLNYRIDLASQAKKKKDAGIVQVKLKRNDLYYELGVGFDFYFEWFKFGTEIKMSYGMFDNLKRENNIYTDGIDKLSSKIWQLSFTFE